MFFNLYIYNLKMVVREKSVVFWLLLYPILLASIYYFSMTNLLTNETFQKIDIAYVENEKIPSDMIEIMKESNMFNIKNTNIDEADEMLSKGEISAYINYNSEMELVVKKEGINESITKVFLDNYSQIAQTIKNIIIENPQSLQTGALDNINMQESNIKDIPIGNSTNILVIYFYATLAMACLNAATLGSNAVILIQANQSNLAARVNVAPTHKLRSYLTMILSFMTFQVISLIITLFYIKSILGIEFGTNMAYVFLICFVGCIMGMAMGSFISAILKKSEGIKTAVILVINLFGCFLAGMMYVDMKYIVQTKFPILSYINPANLITDGLYSLYYYDTLDRYFVNLGILSLYGILFCTLTYLILRRQKYASI